MALLQHDFSELVNTPVENELFAISVNIVVNASEIISELVSSMFSGTLTQLVVFTVCTMQTISSLFISAKFVKYNNGKSGIRWFLKEEYSQTHH